MLASLLPGLRDVRTPLTVGYLWLTVAWIALADRLPRARPTGDSWVSRIFDLAVLTGRPGTLAAITFVAYVVGALFTLPAPHSPMTGRKLPSWPSHQKQEEEDKPTNGPRPDLSADDEFADFVGGVIASAFGLRGLMMISGGDAVSVPRVPRRYASLVARSGAESEQTQSAYLHKLVNTTVRILELSRDLSALGRRSSAREVRTPTVVTAVSHSAMLRTELLRAARTPAGDLRPRLLVENQQLYGEYDRIEAEAHFRVNLCFPIVGLAAVTQQPLLIAVATVIAAALYVQGTRRSALADTVIQRAVLEGRIKHPLDSLLDRLQAQQEAVLKEMQVRGGWPPPGV